jgi:hypothetical protein
MDKFLQDYGAGIVIIIVAIIVYLAVPSKGANDSLHNH